MNKWISIAILFSLVGCTVTPEKSPEATGELVQQEVITTELEHNAIIDEEVLYLLMTAELAGQRNEYYLAMDAYLQAAKRVDDPRIAERAVKIGLFLKDEKRTREALNVWLQKDGSNLSARKFALLLAVKNQDYATSIESLRVLLRSDPAGFEASLLEMLKIFEKENRLEFAYKVLEDLNKQRPQQAELLFVQAVYASVLPDNALAQEKIAQVLQLQPDWSRAIVFQAQLAGRAGDLQKARSFLEKAVKQSPDDVQLRKLLIEMLINTNALDDAIRFCQKVLEDKPDDAESLFSLSMIYLQRNQFEKAENSLEKLLAKPDWHAQASYYLGKLEIERHRPEKALAWFDKVGEGNYAFDADFSAVSLLLSQKRLEQVESRILSMESKYPDQKLRIMMIKAELYNLQGEYQRAFDELAVALQDAPDNRDLLYAQALVAEHINKLDVLEADLQKIILKNPNDVGALNALGYTLTDKTTRYDEAEGYLNRALKLQPDEAVIVDSYGWLQFKLGKLDVALEYLRKAYSKAAENEIAAHISEVLWLMGSEKEAKEFFDNVYRKSPDDEYLQGFKRRYLSVQQK
jgi:tetratricopeptide (TPR) repeat protein